ncbi:MAG: class II aldolase/adducin family protein [Candidatus Binatia bacterium]
MEDFQHAMIQWGARLFERRLVSGWGGNVSCRVGKERILITGQHAPLGFLAPEDLVLVDTGGHAIRQGRQPSSETALHLAVYGNTEAQAVIHAHPPQVLVFSLSHDHFVPLSFEEKYTLGQVAVVPQDTPTVTQPEAVVGELRLRPIVILKGHGTVAMGKDLKEAFLLTDLLEEAVHCQLLKSGKDVGDAAPAPVHVARAAGQRLFSRGHIAALVNAANTDTEFLHQGSETALTTSLTIAREDDGARWTLVFLDGKITSFSDSGEGEFVISGKEEWWKAIFQNQLDPFQATQQGKLALASGEMWKLSRWFKPFQRAFQLWQAIPIK